MRVVIQRVKSASVLVDNKEIARITKGLLLLVGISQEDTEEDLIWLINKIVNLRIFSDDEQKMNLSLLDVQGEALVVSQFTLFAQTKRGNRPSFIMAAEPGKAESLYTSFITNLREKNIYVQEGKFGAEMTVSLINHGPVTLIIDSKRRE
jgi:D-tyrosyl-tRNA(Tyr) deacylase